MTDHQDQTINLRDALDKHLNARSLSKSISTLLQNTRKKINFKPDYQRNYVWDNDKATYFIESILLGIEIPPLIMFIPANDKRSYEVIDGRQRFETLKRFFEGDFKLSKRGLRSLSGLTSKNFQSLDPEIQRVFLNTTIRIIEFSTIGEHPQQDNLEGRIKKEIFWRYNSGITPLKTLEVQRAKHLEDSFTATMELEFADQPTWLEQFKQVFFAKSSSKKLTNAECQAKIRELLVLQHFPINSYSSSSTRRDTVEWLYDLYIEGSNDQDRILQDFIKKIGLLKQLFIALNENQWMIYQGVYWALVILEQNAIDIGTFFDEQTIKQLVVAIHKNIQIFTGDERGFSSITTQRFQYLTEVFKTELERRDLHNVDFAPYLKNPLKVKQDSQSGTDVKESISQLDSMRLNRPDAVTKTIEDLIDDMSSGSFLIRPTYQRQEVINNKKSSGIIESMLLGIPLPTIFICRRADGVCEVVDGQQRLLSILAFLGKPYKNNNNEEVWSQKNKYPLSKKITILKDLGGDKFDELNEDLKDRILDFELSVVYIDAKLNKNFDPIDLFIRLNNKPYPVKDHSFEMWNSYSDRTIINKIKKITESYKNWFYYRKDNRRMDNEELLTIFAYLSYESAQSRDVVFDIVDIYNWAPRSVTFRLSKQLITDWLNADEGSQELSQHDKILSSINDVEYFIQKVEVLARSRYKESCYDTEDLQKLFNELLNIKKGTVRRLNIFYILWFLLLGVEKSIIDRQAATISQELMVFFVENQSVPKSVNENVKVKEIFKRNVENFWAKYRE